MDPQTQFRTLIRKLKLKSAAYAHTYTRVYTRVLTTSEMKIFILMISNHCIICAHNVQNRSFTFTRLSQLVRR